MGFSTHDSDAHVWTESDPSRAYGALLRLNDYSSRKFVPEELFGEAVNLDKIELYGEEEPWIIVGCHNIPPCEGCGWYNGHSDCIFVAIDGACRNNGYPSAQGGYGVYFHYGSTWNAAECLPVESSQTSQRAELSAAIEALERVKQIKEENAVDGLDSVVVKTDSAYVYHGITEYIVKWRRNGYTNARGVKVVNSILFCNLEERIHELNLMKVHVLFWLVPRHRNRPADALANAALDGIPEEEVPMEALFENGRPPKTGYR